MSKIEDPIAFVLRFRGADIALTSDDRQRLLDDSFHEALCRIIYTENNAADRPLITQLVREEIRLRRADQCHNGDRVILSALLLALLREVADVPLLWEAKCVDFDMGCYFDGQLLAFGGLDDTIRFLRQQPGNAASEAADYLDECRDDEDYEDIDRFIKFKLDYFRLPHERVT